MFTPYVLNAMVDGNLKEKGFVLGSQFEKVQPSAAQESVTEFTQVGVGWAYTPQGLPLQPYIQHLNPMARRFTALQDKVTS